MAKPNERLSELLTIKLSPSGDRGSEGEGWLLHSDPVNRGRVARWCPRRNSARTGVGGGVSRRSACQHDDRHAHSGDRRPHRLTGEASQLDSP